MSVLVFATFVAAATLFILAVAMFVGGQKYDISQLVQRRFRALAKEAISEDGKAEAQTIFQKWWSRKLLRAGIGSIRRATIFLIIVSCIAFMIGVSIWGGKGLVLPLAVVLAIHALLERRSRLRADALLAQLPAFVDQVVRSLSVGHSLEQTILLAAKHSRSPLADVLERVHINCELGANMSEELMEAARTHRLRELQLLALAVQVGQRYGGSARDLMQSIVTMIQQRDQAHRELRALTGETRLSAWVLGLLPVLVASYIAATNPGYLEFMWLDDGGRKVFVAAVGMQCIGGLILWRMVRSI